MDLLATETTLRLNLSKVKNAIILATTFAGTKDETLKSLFKDVLIEVPYGDKNYCVISSSNSREIFQINIPIEKENLEEPLALRVDSAQLKSIISNFNDNLKIEISDKFYKFSGKNSSIKIHQITPEILKEQFELLKLEEEKEHITTVEANKLFHVINNVALIPKSEQKNGRPLEIRISNSEIKTTTIQENGYYAAISKIEHLSDQINEEEQILIPANVVTKVLYILKAFKNKPIEIYTNTSRSKLQIKTNIFSYTFYLSNEKFPNAFEVVENFAASKTKELLTNKEKLVKALELVKSINSELSSVKINVNEKTLTMTSKDKEEITQTIEVSSDDQIFIPALVKTALESIKVCFNNNNNTNPIIKIKADEDNLTYSIQPQDSEYPIVMFAGIRE